MITTDKIIISPVLSFFPLPTIYPDKLIESSELNKI